MDSNTSPNCSSDLLDWMRLHLATLYHPEVHEILLDRLGNMNDVLRFVRDLDETTGAKEELSPRLIQRLMDPIWTKRATRELELCHSHSVDIHLKNRAGWPSLMGNLSHMPLTLFSRGDWRTPMERTIGIVGTRQPTPYGIRQARRFAGELASLGVTIVSGLARGIDAEAHRAALEAGGKTMAVLGSGLSRIYPRENKLLALSIQQENGGLLISEFPWDMAPLRHHFPQRNRLISALSLGVIVIEAGEKSGSLITVDWTLRQGRPVFALPGRVDQPQARGCLSLIQNGALPILGPEDVIESIVDIDLNSSDISDIEKNRRTCSRDSGDKFLCEIQKLFVLKDDWHPDEMCQRLDMEPSALLLELTRLEAGGILRKIIGGKYILIQ